MPIDPVKIPQNVYVEDRIIGPVTLRQIMIVMAGTGVSYAIWAAIKAAGPTSGVLTAIAWIPAVIAVLFAFVKINGISLLSIVFLSLEKISKPATRVWVPRQGIYVNIMTKAPKVEKNEEVIEKEAQRKSTPLEELGRVLDQGPPEQTIGQEENTKASGELQDADTESTPPKPVNPSRISAATSQKPLDDITPPTKEDRKENGPIFRDIVPPTSHA